MDTLILGIESSCDETSAAVVKNGKVMLSNVVSSQIEIHNLFGGVVPEIASRKHTETIIEVINQALLKSEVTLKEVDAVAVTEGPGLIGSLLIGISTAKTLAFSIDKPLVGVNHLEAHISAIHLQDEIDFPFVSLIVSGGHTNLYLVNDYLDFKLLGNTRDDAAGEAFDKAAKVLNLGYPGGIEIDKRAKHGDPKSIKFPRPFNNKTYDFSFSGLKTSLINFVNKNKIKDENELNNICASFQEAIVETLIDKLLNAAEKMKVKNILIAGGVACNSRLRQLSRERIENNGIKVFIPAPALCTDNAAMIAALGYYKYKNGEFSDLSLSPYSTKRINHIS
ncbi:MAG: tRNA (adenosine(37)-N6)-threonylcarbamoyltransferase complex transferase subunit TsaD [Thermodesulfobacteriota bacterium]